MTRSREVLILALILAVGALLRAAYLTETLADPAFQNPGVDAGYHDYWAWALATGDWTPPGTFNDPGIRTTPFFRPPGYPYFLAGVYKVFGPSRVPARIVQMLLGLGNCLLAFFVGRRLFGRSVGLIFAVLMSVYWVFIYYEAELLEPVLLVTLTLALIYGLSLWTERITFTRALAVGVILGLFALVRPNVLTVGIAIPIWAWWALRRNGTVRQLPVAVLGLGLGCALTVAPATIRNYRVSHEFVPISSNAGINIYIGNNEYANGLCAKSLPGLGSFRTCFDYPQVVESLERKLGKRLTHSQASAYYSRIGVEYAREHPLRTLGLMARKTLLFWGPKEVSHNKEDELERAHSRTLRSIPLTFPLALGMAVIGAVLMLTDLRPRRKDTPAALRRQYEILVLIMVFVAVYFATHLPFFIAGRYRVPVIPPLLLLGAYGLNRICGFLRGRGLGKAALWSAAAAAACALASANFARFEPDEAKWHNDRGLVLALSGRNNLAINEYEKALAADPFLADAHVNLGAALAEKGGLDEAIAHYREAIAINPNLAEAHCNLGGALISKGLAAEGIAECKEALRIWPRMPSAHYNLGVAFHRQGKLPAAIREYRAVLAINPNRADARRNLAAAQRRGHPGRIAEVLKDAIGENRRGSVLAGQGEIDEAIAHWKRALRIAPDYAEVHHNLAIAYHLKGDYAAAWKEIDQCRKLGLKPNPSLVHALSEKMRDPGEPATKARRH